MTREVQRENASGRTRRAYLKGKIKGTREQRAKSKEEISLSLLTLYSFGFCS
jgi:hypothetical protein